MGEGTFKSIWQDRIIEGMDICLIGAGNLATQLGTALASKGCAFSQVYSRTELSARKLADVLNCEAVTQLNQISPHAELYICLLTDDVLPKVLPQINFGKGMVVHTAGSLPMRILEAYTSDYGVIYPLQTFSKQRNVDFSEVPFFIEAASPEGLGKIRGLVSKLSDIIILVNSDQRQYLHLSAVFANNFVNYLYMVAEDLVNEQGLDPKYLLPLIKETAGKVQDLSPRMAQTGPAVRYDTIIIGKQLELLQNHLDWKSLYEIISKGIHQQVQEIY